MTGFVLARCEAIGDDLLDVPGLARRVGLHPDLIRRLFALGLFDAAAEVGGEPRFAPAAVLRLRRMVRLRQGLGLPWHALGLVSDLLDRIEALEASLARQQVR